MKKAQCLLWFVAAAAGVLADGDGAGSPSAGGASPEELLARALGVIDRQSARIDELARQNTELRELAARQADQLAEANAAIAVLQRMLFGRSSEKSGAAPGGSGDDDDDDDAGPGDGGNRGSGKKVKRGPGARSGRRDYSGLPRFEVF
jgi:transposase